MKISLKFHRRQDDNDYHEKPLGGGLLKACSILFATSLMFIGCANTSSASGDSQTGYLIDSAVAGVEYRCGATTGLTGSDGSFSCSSFPISFNIGALSLGFIGSIPTDGKAMPQDLAGTSRTDTSNNAVLNIASLLQSLDDDANLNNGISISSNIRAAFKNAKNVQTLNFADITLLVTSVGKRVVSYADAMAHLNSNTPELSSSSSSSSSSSGGSSTQPTPTLDPAPTLTTTPTHTKEDNVTVEVNGEVNASIFVNSVDTKVDINSSSKANIDLNTSGADGVKSFSITLRGASNTTSSALEVSIIKDTQAPTKFSWVYGVDSNSSSVLTNRRVSFDEDISTTGISITLSNDGNISDIAVNENNVSFSYQKINTDENLTITGTDLAGNAFNITRGTKIVLKTGQTTSYTANDDGAYQKGVARSYTDNGDQTVTDNATGLIWQKEDDDTERNWTDAGTYCADLNLGSSTDWRLPSIEELLTITDLGRNGPAIDPVFTNTNSSHYWSSTTSAGNSTFAWIVSFSNGYDYIYGKTNTAYVRCVR